MDDDAPAPLPAEPSLTPAALAAREARRAREAAALRDNLRRRKEHARGRTTPASVALPEDGPCR